MATYNKIADWVENEGEVADLDADQFVVALSNTAPGSDTGERDAGRVYQSFKSEPDPGVKLANRGDIHD